MQYSSPFRLQRREQDDVGVTAVSRPHSPRVIVNPHPELLNPGEKIQLVAKLDPGAYRAGLWIRIKMACIWF